MSVVAHSYARAFLEMAPKGYDVAAFLESAAPLARAIGQNATLRAFLSAPAVPQAAKTQTIAQLAAKVGLDVFGGRFFEVMLLNHRLLEAEGILESVRQESDAKRGIIQGRVTVAAPIGEEEKKAIESALAIRLGATVKLSTQVDPEILAGFVARVGSSVFDASAATAIRRFQEQARGKTGA